MVRQLQRHEPALGGVLLGSLLLHAGLFVLITTLHFLPSTAIEEPVYYVDMVNLPVANPRAGTPASPAPSPTPPAAAKAPEPSVLHEPAKAATKAAAVPTQKSVKPAKTAEEAAAKAFAQRMAKLEQDAEARHETAALDALRKKLAAAGTPGMPKGKGTQTGSDYGAYIQSRLRDALATTIVYQSRKPEMAVRLFIDRHGKLTRILVEKGSSDRLFNDSVLRAIAKAKANFPPTPNGSDFSKLFVFSPEEVGRK